RCAQSGRDRRGLDGLPAAHRLPLPRVVLGLDGCGLSRSPEVGHEGASLPSHEAGDSALLLPANPAARGSAPRRDGRGRALIDGNSRGPLLVLTALSGPGQRARPGATTRWDARGRAGTPPRRGCAPRGRRRGESAAPVPRRALPRAGGRAGATAAPRPGAARTRI